MIMEKQAPEYRRLSDWVVGRIIAALREGLLLPGQVLVERDLAEMLSVSRQPVRDGLRTLEHLGVVVSEGRKTYVRSWLPVDVADTQVIMNELTLLALRLAAPRISDDDIAELRKIAEESRVAHDQDSNDYATQAQLDFRFHLVIAEASNNNRLVEMIKWLCEPRLVYEEAFLIDQGYTRWSQVHSQIVEALAAKHPEEAIEISMAAIAEAQQRLVAALDKARQATDGSSEPTDGQ
jgi:DNA-binding GntR family transcriptional regulator